MATSERAAGGAAVRGMDRAVAFARGGHLISAIKWLEANNPTLLREQAKALVRSFGYSSEGRWPESERSPVRRL